ncbi:MAG TPA: hypothetical protein VH419_00255 [Nocardioidaceae bacterium]
MPSRVTVTSPRTSAPHRRRTPATQEIDDQTVLGEIYMRSLIRAQLRLGAVVLLVLAVTLGGLPLLFAQVPAVRDAHIVGIPLPWLILGVLVYPVLLGLGWYYVRQSERNERDFSELVDRR